MREPMITRTIKFTEAEVLCANLTNEEMTTRSFTLPRTYHKEDALLKAVNKCNQNKEIKPLAIKSTTVIEKRYGMTEAQFLANATEITKGDAE